MEDTAETKPWEITIRLNATNREEAIAQARILNISGQLYEVVDLLVKYDDNDATKVDGFKLWDELMEKARIVHDMAINGK